MSNPFDMLRSQISMMGLDKPDAYNPYAAGPKVYDGASMAPNVGAIGDRAGYAKRDLQAQARKQAIMKRLQAQFGGGRIPGIPAASGMPSIPSMQGEGRY